MKLLFKARGCESKKWYEGLITHLDEDTCHIKDKEQRVWFCDPSTICQYKGFNDKNGKKVFDGDICKYHNAEEEDGVAIIKEDYAKWISGSIQEKEGLTPLFYLKCSEEWEVIGNVYDNPELIENSE